MVSQESKKDESKLPEVGTNPQSEVEDVFTSTRAQPHQVPVTPDSTLSGKSTDESSQAFKPADYEQTAKNDQSSSSSSSSSKTPSTPTTPGSVVSQAVLYFQTRFNSDDYEQKHDDQSSSSSSSRNTPSTSSATSNELMMPMLLQLQTLTTLSLTIMYSGFFLYICFTATFLFKKKTLPISPLISLFRLQIRT